MESGQGKDLHTQPPPPPPSKQAEEENHHHRHLHLPNYGIPPRMGGLLLGQQKRKYFDSGDFALSAAHKMTTDEDAIQTGVAHPLRESISRPFAPVPSTSNAEKDANRSCERMSPGVEMARSPLEEGDGHFDS